MEHYVADTHALVWFITKDSRLSKRAGSLLTRAESAEVQLFVPTLVLAELAYIAQKKRVKASIHEVLHNIEQGDGFTIVPFDLQIFKRMLDLPRELEIHDRIIAATANYYQAKLITRDAILKDSADIETVW
jgi:predicted nucleic acid-binding protein